MERKRIIAIIIIAAVILGGAGWYFYQLRNGHELAASGTIEATEVTVSSKVTGKVLELKVDEGTQVAEGAILAVLDVQELQEGLKSARAKHDIANEDYNRSKKLYADRMISPQQYDASSSALTVASAAFQLARIQVENATIKAPIKGVVLVKAIEKGELATVGTPIVTIADLEKVKLTVYLGERNIGKIKLGETVSISVDAYPNDKFSGKIVYISDKAEFTPKSIQTKEERVTQVFAIKIEIPNPGMKLKPGMPADAFFAWNTQ